MNSSLDKIVENVDNTINRYNLLQPKEELIVAFSGGKDSLTAIMALRELGFKVRVISINMCFNDSWAENIKDVSKKYNLQAELLEPTKLCYIKEVDTETGNNIINNLMVLNNSHLLGYKYEAYTPCTACYNIKILTFIEYARKLGIKSVIYGHHATDAVSSLMKSAMFYIDRWEEDHEVFKRSNYEGLVNRIFDIYLQNADYYHTKRFFNKIAGFVEQAVASTDEPPKQPISETEHSINIIRPLFGVYEEDIIRYAQSIKYRFVCSGCEVGVKPKLTPREIVHHKIVAMPKEKRKYFQDNLYASVLKCVSDTGFANTNARKRRSEILGQQYKKVQTVVDKI